jgi:two-component system response regulator GlrR
VISNRIPNPGEEEVWPEPGGPESSPDDERSGIVSSDVAGAQRFEGLVGRSAAMRKLFSLLRRAATSDSTVLLEGETGAGKELSAQAIHARSRRSEGPFVVVDCGAIPPQLLESELFGFARGAFTGADTARQGAFEAASGGTIFLDEIGELGLDLQSKVLRAIETKRIKRVGNTMSTEVDVRVIAATNRSLKNEVKAGRYRADLYYRLAVIKVHLPALRERADDFPLLVECILDQLGARASSQAAVLGSPDFVAKLAGYEWPGNVRQLRNYVERSIAFGEARLPSVNTMHPPGDPPRSKERSTTADSVDASLPFKEARASQLASFERKYLEVQLSRCGDLDGAASASGLTRDQFYQLMWKHGMRLRRPRVATGPLAHEKKSE